MNYGNRKKGAGEGLAQTRRIDLGLALLHRVALPGVSYSFREIAAWCDCHHGAIQHIELKALRKLRNALQFRDRRLHAELAVEFFERRSIAVSRNAQGERSTVSTFSR